MNGVYSQYMFGFMGFVGQLKVVFRLLVRLNRWLLHKYGTH